MAAAFVARPAGGRELWLAGDFDVAGVEAYEAALSEITPKPNVPVLIDLSELTFMASAGLSCLVRTDASHGLVLRGAGEQVQKLLEITGLANVFRRECDEAQSA
jgi:anti-anti-sigma factor